MTRRERLESACRANPVAALYLFGSRADDGVRVLEGETVERMGSDLDVGVLFSTGAGSSADCARLLETLEDVFLPLRIDLVALDRVDALFQFRAIDGHRVFAASAEQADRYELLTMRRAAELLPIERAIERAAFGVTSSVTAGNVDLKIVGERLDIARRAVADFRSLPQSSMGEFTADRRNVWSADSLLRRAIEALFDTARHLLAKRFGRGGLEYREVARLLIEHGLVAPDGAGARLLEIAGFRNRLAHHYDVVTPEELYTVLQSHLRDLDALIDALRSAAGRLVDPDSRQS